MYYNRFTDGLMEENKQLKRQIEFYESKDFIQKNKELCEKRLRHAQEREKKQHDGWMKCLEVNKELKERNSRLWEEKEDYKKRLKTSFRRQENLEILVKREENLRTAAEERIEKLEEEKKEKERENEALKEELCRLRALLDRDGTTNGIPTSQTPVNKKKVIPNSREKSSRNRGGQKGHRKHSFSSFQEKEITENVIHTEEVCPECGGRLKELEEDIKKDEADYEVRIIKRRHHFRVYQCRKCGKKIHAKIPKELKENNQYGPNVQALILALTDLGFVSVNRSKKMLEGMLGGEIAPSEGYVGKVRKKMSGRLREFRREVRIFCLKQRVLHWDDTVVFMNTKRACLRFYGNEKAALYYAHKAKDAKGIERDGILPNLTEGTYLMHDHIKYNYRREFLFKNIECAAHLQRELQKVYNDSGHQWALEMKELIGSMIHKRKEYLLEGKEGFGEEETKEFETRLKYLEAEGKRRWKESEKRYFYAEEGNALKKIEEYRENYFAWVYDFTLPTTNNLAESGLRMTKSKMKISGQFGKEETAEEFALIRTYTETCKRNGINEYEALLRLTSGNPYTLAELMG